jgi:bifunctional UDP-N-acetylglucosamine pyrophosphorylase/glucosamine-1-phosphate N-acetyltransferase
MNVSSERGELLAELGRLGCLDADGKPSRAGLKRPVVAIIPAAGKGSRLEFDGPKVLFPLAGKPVLRWIIDAIDDLVVRSCLVVNPAHERQISKYVRTAGLQIELAIQENPTGMGDAILCAEPLVEAEEDRCDYLIVWGDQVTVSRETILICLLHHQNSAAKPAMTLPTCRIRNPYIHFEREKDGALAGILQRREGDAMPEKGETDCGVFIVKGEHLFAKLRSFKKENRMGRKSSEFNFLPFIAHLSRSGYTIDLLPIADELETRGINSLEDIEFIQGRLRR